MKIVKPSIEIINRPKREEALNIIEIAARTCYKSEDKITEGSSTAITKSLIKSGHMAMLEHVVATVRVVCDRGVSHEIVRHRLASYAQESTRYCNYSGSKFGGEIAFIEPTQLEFGTTAYASWKAACLFSERCYMSMLREGVSPQIARGVLPNSLKTEIVITMNLREWIHFFNLRSKGTTGAPHPQMKEVADMLYEDFKEWLPEVFGE